MAGNQYRDYIKRSFLKYACSIISLLFVLMGLFNLTFLPMHYKNGYDLGKPFVVSSVVLFLAIVLLETLDHVVPYMKTVCESYAPADLVRQLPVLLGGVAVYALVTYLAFRTSAARFEQVDL